MAPPATPLIRGLAISNLLLKTPLSMLGWHALIAYPPPVQTDEVLLATYPHTTLVFLLFAAIMTIDAVKDFVFNSEPADWSAWVKHAPSPVCFRARTQWIPGKTKRQNHHHFRKMFTTVCFLIQARALCVS